MNQVALVKNRYRLEQWTELIRDCRSSGMKINDWCEANGVSRNAYFYWLRKVRSEACRNLPEDSGQGSAPAFSRLEVQMPTAGARPSVTVYLPQATVEIQDGISAQTVEAVLLALKSVC